MSKDAKLDQATRSSLGRYFKSLAQNHSTTQVQLCAALGIERGQISRVWRGLVKKSHHYEAIAEHFGLDLDDAIDRALQLDQALGSDTKEGDLMAAALDLDAPGVTRSGEFGPQALVIAVASEKGGVGKTALAVNLAHLWAKQGHSVLLVDLDTQGNATRHVGGELSGEALEAVTDARSELELEPDDHAFGFDIVRGGRYILGAVSHIQQRRLPSVVLRRVLRPLRERYDIILLDTPPTLGILSINAIVSATHLLVPVQLEGAALDGLDAVLETAEELLDVNPELELLGAVPMMHDKRTAISKMLMRRLHEMDYANPIDAPISRNVSIAESYLAEEPVCTYAPSSQGARDFRRLAKALTSRLQS